MRRTKDRRYADRRLLVVAPCAPSLLAVEPLADASGTVDCAGFFFELLMERQEEGVTERLLPSEIRVMAAWAARFSGQGPIARLPFELQIK